MSKTINETTGGIMVKTHPKQAKTATFLRWSTRLAAYVAVLLATALPTPSGSATFEVLGVYPDDPAIPGMAAGDMVLVDKTPSLFGAFDGHGDAIATFLDPGWSFIETAGFSVGDFAWNAAVESDKDARELYVFTGVAAGSFEGRATSLTSQWIRTDDNTEPNVISVSQPNQFIDVTILREGTHVVIASPPLLSTTTTTLMEAGTRPITLFFVNTGEFTQNLDAEDFTLPNGDIIEGLINGLQSFSIPPRRMAVLVRLNRFEWFAQ